MQSNRSLLTLVKMKAQSIVLPTHQSQYMMDHSHLNALEIDRKKMYLELKVRKCKMVINDYSYRQKNKARQ